LNKTFTHEFYNELYNFFINRDLNNFNARLIPKTDIKNDMIERCKESWLLFFEDNISKFMKRYPRKLAYIDYANYCRDVNYMPFSNTKFGLKLKNVVICFKTTKDYKTVRYYQIKEDVKSRYEIENDMLELNDNEVECI
jgi:CRISPR/Cas system type I-B associated protein Csh2 (Cas7 group RAMP superfamily)